MEKRTELLVLWVTWWKRYRNISNSQKRRRLVDYYMNVI